MKLQLHLHHIPQGSASAAFLFGKNPAFWLEQIQSWGIHPQSLEAFAVPQSLRSLELAGLLVVLKQGDFPAQLELQEAYRRVGTRLLIPRFCSVLPQIAESEWSRLLHYDYHFFHPGIGMVGFNKSDQLDLAALLSYPDALDIKWDLAQRGPLKDVPLRQIGLVEPPVENLFNQVQGVGDKKLDELIPNSKLDKNEAADLQLNVLDKLNNLLNQRPELRENQQQGWLGKFLDQIQRNIQQRLNDLRQKRDSEIDRLLQLFKENPEEALRYSLPLNSPYEGRGIAPPSDTLGRKDNPDFDLQGLGYGGAVDAWDLKAKQEAALRQNYLNLANQKIAEADFRKAAYIHAHLLGDFQSAANVLLQGKFYHDAAILYRDHLNNPRQAAFCFEQGRLFHDAIQLYLQLNEQEKAGDLYTLLDQSEEAEKLYLACVNNAIGRSDFLDAARLFQHKLHNEASAQSTLLQGWQKGQHPVTCLSRYLDFFKSSGFEALDLEIQRIYEQGVPLAQRKHFLEVLKQLNPNQRDNAHLPLARHIVYTMVSHEMMTKKTDHLQLLTAFVPEDKLLHGDISRFETEIKNEQLYKRKAPQTGPLIRFQFREEIILDQYIYWIEAKVLNFHVFALGIKDAKLYLSISDFKGNTKQQIIGDPFHYSQINRIIASPVHSNYFGISNAHLDLDFGNWINEGFQMPRMRILQLYHLGTPLAYGCTGHDKLVVLQRKTDGVLHLEYLDSRLRLKNTFTCIPAENTELYFVDSSVHDFAPVPFFPSGRKFYTHFPGNDLIFQISSIGEVKTLKVGEGTIHKLIFGDPYDHQDMAVVTGPSEFGTFACWYFQEFNGEIKACGEAFATGHEIDHLLFFEPGLVIVRENQVSIYKTRISSTPYKLASFDLQETVIDLFKGQDIYTIGFLTQSGKIEFYKFDELNV